ncbi:MAG: histidine kinase dimerization/phospho-acceptor domain-containing protein, partial [Myxococcota bacterium]|nr:histidine kinase dimerization/phospho-acceptor domain-containing protein [Myxococcota bacterium]
MSIAPDNTLPQDTIRHFLARWGSLFDSEAFPIAVLSRGDFGLVYLNSSATTVFGGADTEAAIRDALPVEAIQSVDTEGRWEGPCEIPLLGPCTSVAMTVGAAGATEGIFVSWHARSRQSPPYGDGVAVHQVLQCTSDLVIGVDVTGRVVYRNQPALTFFPREILGHRAEDMLQGAAVQALGGGAPGAEWTVDALGERRMVQWRGVSARILLRESSEDQSETDSTTGTLNARLALGKDLTEEHLASQQVRIRVQRLEAMHAISLAIGRGDPLMEVYAMAFQRLCDVIPLRQGKLYMIDRGESNPSEAYGQATLRGVFTYNRGAGHSLDETLPLSDHPTIEACVRHLPVQRETSGPPALRWPILRSLGRMGVRAVLSVPLLKEDRALGVLWLATGRPAGFSPDDQEAAEELASQLSNAIIRQQLADEIASHARDLEQRVEDRTAELRQTQDQLLQAAKLSTIGEMAAGVAHELNQPLNVLSGYIELLEEGGLTGASSSKALRMMELSTDRMSTLVLHLRNFSRTSGDERGSVDLCEVLTMAKELSSRASKEHVEVHWDAPENACCILGDSNRLEQLFINLLSNAMQATESNEGAHVHLCLETFGP